MTFRDQSMQTTVGDALATHRLLASISDSPLLDCQLLLCHVLGVPRSWLYAHAEEALTACDRDQFNTMMTKRKHGMPVAYLIGHRWFWNMELEVSEATLVPRPETELLVETMLARVDDGNRTILDAGTGTGAIAIALAAERPSWRIVATERSRSALEVAARNIQRWSQDRVTLLQGDWLNAIAAGSLDAVVCNPPYIAENDVHLHALAHEPRNALSAGPDGLVDIRKVIAGAIDCLRPGGLLVMEHGYDQADATRRLAQSAGFHDMETLLDQGNRARILVAGKRQ